MKLPRFSLGIAVSLLLLGLFPIHAQVTAGASRDGSVGRVLDHVRVRVDDGAILVEGHAFPGYLGQPPACDALLDTGDLGHVDADGYLYVTGRRKHVLITGYGRNVSPEWIEAELSLCPGIAQSFVVGDGRPYCGAVVVPRRGSDAALRRSSW